MRTAAPSPAVATGSRPRSATPPRRRRARLTARATILLTIVVAILMLSVAPARMYFAQREELAQLERQSTILARGNERLSERAAQLKEPDYLERLARRCLGMVRRGETAFVVVPEHGAPAPPPEC